MQDAQRELLNRYWNQLMNLTEVHTFANTLVAKEIFTQREILDFFAGHNEQINNCRFFNSLLDKDATAFDTLLQWLITTGRDRLARKLAPGGPGITPFREPNDEHDPSSPIETFSFDKSKEPLKINVQLATEFRDSIKFNPNLPFYSCRSSKRGRVLIINNFDFDGTDHKTRNGAQVDQANLLELFAQMGGWVVKTKNNKTADEMRQILKSFAKEKREKRCDICFVFIMSHGSEELKETIIYGRDGTYLSTSDIQSYFTNEKCPLFRGKPKVFIYQVCRGNDIDLPQTFTEFDGKCKNKEEQQQAMSNSRNQSISHFRPVEDMLIGYATMQGSKAHRDPYRGTWYIELICKYFMQLAHYESVDNLLVKVDEGLRTRMSEYGTVQTSEHISKGFKKLYLNPGIFEENGKVSKFESSVIESN
ncbi:hypothetical protein ABEB36_006518 [Hypothenemus hampei]|uniref:Uncharacterized protein n=1 Tax=Hypothenemus hampei TaxID=57062 RepID=A0ABD1EQT5_HYPHA